MNQSLIIFSRYPEPGKTKTRMIPVLGAEGAANLQRQMTEHTLRQVKQLQRLEIEIHFTGGNEHLMTKWLGNSFTYYVQILGDLGKRMESAFAQAFERKKKQVVIIGIDCPDLNSSIIQTAFDALQQQDLVLGAAEDGGYYLIGLNRSIPELFQDINWGSDRVLSQTQAIAHNLGLNICYLPKLRDVDYPEDLLIWQKYET